MWYEGKEWQERSEDQWPVVAANAAYEALYIHRFDACENKQGPGWTGKTFTVTVLDKDGTPRHRVRVGFSPWAVEGVAYDHPNIWGLTDEDGRMAWDHLGVATRYSLWVEGQDVVKNIRVDLGYEYCRKFGSRLPGFRPTNKPGIYSYDIHIVEK